jgi:hypothetical protein
VSFASDLEGSNRAARQLAGDDRSISITGPERTASNGRCGATLQAEITHFTARRRHGKEALFTRRRFP